MTQRNNLQCQASEFKKPRRIFTEDHFTLRDGNIELLKQLQSAAGLASARGLIPGVRGNRGLGGQLEWGARRRRGGG